MNFDLHGIWEGQAMVKRGSDKERASARNLKRMPC